MATSLRTSGNPPGRALNPARDKVKASRRVHEGILLWSDTLSCERLIDCLVGAACVSCHTDRTVPCARLLGAAESLSMQLGYVIPHQMKDRVNQAIQHCRSTLGDELFTAAWSCGSAQSLDELIAETSALLVELSDQVQIHEMHAKKPAGLTPRELDVVQLLTLGKSNREIAHTLFVSRNTAITHVRHIMSKLELDSRTAVAAWAVRNGFD